MPIESLEKSGILENLSKELIAKSVKTAKKEATSKTKVPISICDIMKTDTSEIIKKIQSQMLLRMELFSDLYMKYLHSLDDLYGTCYVSEKEFFDNLPIDKDVLQTVVDYWIPWKQLLFLQMDAESEFEKGYVHVRKSMIDSYDSYMHLWMESYAKSLSQINIFTDKKNSKTR